MLLNLGIFKEVLHEVFHLLGLLVGRVGVLEDILFTLVLFVLNQPQVANDTGQRGSQVVTDVGNQLIL